jgi:trans-aconitate methyltransferase
MNIILTAHEDTSKDEITGRLFKAIDLTGKLAQRIPGYFNEFWHTEVVQQTGKDPEFKVRTRSDQVYAARTSYKGLQTLEDQGKIWEKIIKERGGNK